MSKPAKEMILVLDFGGQYNQLIARRVREEHVYCEVHPHTLSLEKIKEKVEKKDDEEEEDSYELIDVDKLEES